MTGRSGGTFLCGFIVGVLVGAATILLLAPASGEETRARLREWGIEVGGRARGLVAEFEGYYPRRQAREQAAELPGDGGVPPR